MMIINHRRLVDISIRVTVPRGLETNFFPTKLDIAPLRPLLVFSKLTRLHIDRLCAFDLADDGLMQLATVWPLLKELVLNLHSEWQRHSGISLKGHSLGSLLRVCPLLQDLALVIDATQSLLLVAQEEVFTTTGLNASIWNIQSSRSQPL
ncbi:hypothetical protein BJ138DRAFT_539985 [Hygrophoropsis aurantiaca]|uniref:Uncharacterized protein n=1 Tax=Hygrophoropsis aurantiaca TaxID=72124 RepID=A0ACB8ALH4_9AGAM|nr:hypothetical protein BJ138DRAFT_539985 [Hygrophoropsis aurantiaca]